MLSWIESMAGEGAGLGVEHEVVNVHLVAQLAGEAGLSELELTPLPLRSRPLWFVTSTRQCVSRDRLRLFALTKEFVLLLCPLARSASM